MLPFYVSNNGHSVTMLQSCNTCHACTNIRFSFSHFHRFSFLRFLPICLLLSGTDAAVLLPLFTRTRRILKAGHNVKQEMTTDACLSLSSAAVIISRSSFPSATKLCYEGVQSLSLVGRLWSRGNILHHPEFYKGRKESTEY